MTSHEEHSNAQWADDYFELGEMAFGFGLKDVARMAYEQASNLGDTRANDRLLSLEKELANAADMELVPSATEHEDDEEDIGELHESLIAQMDSGDMDAANQLGNLMVEVEMYEEAIMFHEIAALEGHTDAQNNLGGDYYSLGDIENSIKWYTMAAEAGYALAQNNLATVYMRQSQPHLAMPWLQKAAAAGNTTAKLNLAQLLAEQGVLDDALALIKPIADSGAAGKIDSEDLANAQNNVGMLYAMMNDLASAKRYWLMASRRAHALALYNLGMFYKNQTERTLAIEWLKLAARRKHPTAQQVIDNYDNDKGWLLEDS